MRIFCVLEKRTMRAKLANLTVINAHIWHDQNAQDARKSRQRARLMRIFFACTKSAMRILEKRKKESMQYLRIIFVFNVWSPCPTQERIFADERIRRHQGSHKLKKSFCPDSYTCKFGGEKKKS